MNPERALALSYAPTATRAAASAVFALDDALAQIARTTTEPMIGQLRFTWWFDRLSALDSAPPAAEPVLSALHGHALPAGVTTAMLTPIIEGWEVMLEPELDAAALNTFAQGRGSGVFAAAGKALGAASTDPVVEAGHGWALVDLAWHVGDRELAAHAVRLAEPWLERATTARWSSAGRPLGALALLARADLDLSQPRQIGSPRRVGRMLWHRISGR